MPVPTSVDERRARGKDARTRMPRSVHSGWVPAADLKDTPAAGLPAQLCGDAHLLNFGVFGSPERRLVFDLNDFDETLPGPADGTGSSASRRSSCRSATSPLGCHRTRLTA
jgi:hypothetical protein